MSDAPDRQRLEDYIVEERKHSAIVALKRLGNRLKGGDMSNKTYEYVNRQIDRLIEKYDKPKDVSSRKEGDSDE